MAMTLEDACKKATELAHLTLDFAGGTGALSDLFRILGLDPENKDEELLMDCALDRLVSSSLDNFANEGMIMRPRLV